MTLPEAVQQLFKNQVFSGIAGGSLMMSVVYALKGIPQLLWDMTKWRFTSTVLVYNEDPAFDVVSDWLSDLSYTKKARKLRLTSRYSEAEQNNVPKYSPGRGKHLVWHRRRPIQVYRYTPDNAGSSGSEVRRRENIEITTLGPNPYFLHTLIEEMVAARAAATKTQIEVFTFSNSYWKLACRKDKRSLESVILPDGLTENLVADIDGFIANRAWYAERGIPYRRGFLFQGPPGCGKTSLTLALASRFGRPIYALNIGSLSSDDDLIEAITTVPESAFLLIEDVDAAQVDRTMRASSSKPNKQVKPLSLSALLNSIDGVFSREGRVLIMTTNHPDAIDPAIVRPGRADRRITIGMLGAGEGVNMCSKFMDLPDAFLFASKIRFPIAAAELQEKLREEVMMEAAE